MKVPCVIFVNNHLSLESDGNVLNATTMICVQYVIMEINTMLDINSTESLFLDAKEV